MMSIEECVDKARNIVKRFSLVSDAELSLADIQWLTKEIKQSLIQALTKEEK